MAVASRQPEPAALLDPEQIYLVESLEDPTALLARQARLAGDLIGWDDTNRDRLHRVSKLERAGDQLTVVTEAGLRYRFRPLTLELYQQHVQAGVELSPSFSSTEALRAFYRTASF